MQIKRRGMSAMSAMSELNGCPSLMSVDSKQGRQIRGGANKRVYLEQCGAEERSSKAISVTTVLEWGCGGGDDDGCVGGGNCGRGCGCG